MDYATYLPPFRGTQKQSLIYVMANAPFNSPPEVAGVPYDQGLWKPWNLIGFPWTEGGKW